QLDALASQVATQLAAHGVRSGDVFSSLLPNRAEAAVLFFAASRLGAVLNPIVPIYGKREIRFILRQTESVLAVVPETHRGGELVGSIEQIRDETPALRGVLLVGDHFGLDAYHALAPVEQHRRPEVAA